jgi:hypothetical protein
VHLGRVDRQPAAHLLLEPLETLADLGRGARVFLLLARFEPLHEPSETAPLAWGEGRLLRLQPFELHLGIATRVRGRCELAQRRAHALRDTAFELRAESAQAAAQSPQPDAAVVQRFEIFGILQPAPCRGGFVEEGERQQTRRLLRRLGK